MRKKRIAHGILTMVLVCVFMFLPMESEAGMSETILDSTTLEGNNWSNPEEDVTVVDGTIVFPKTSTEYTRFISKSSAKKDEMSSELVKLSANMKFNEIPNGKSFILGFGLSGVEVLPGEAENVEVTFSNNGGIKVGITAYDEEGNVVTVAEPKSCGIALKKSVTVDVKITTDAKIQVSVNGGTICSATLPVSGEGRVGFLQTGECSVEVSNLKITHYKYERPENANVNEDFEHGSMDISVLTSDMIDLYSSSYPRGVMVEEYNGSKVLLFQNVAESYVGTIYKYSNFEMTFDVPYIQAEAEYHEDGSPSKRAQTSFTVTFGGEQPDWEKAGGWKKAAEAIVYSKGSVYSNNSKELKGELNADYFTKQNGGFSIKLTVVDGVVSTGIKWIGEKQYQTILTYKLSGGMPLGYIDIWSTSVGQFAIDNLQITNLDDTPNVIETEFKSGDYVVPEDTGYIPTERVYNEVEQEDEQISWYWLIATSAGIGVVAMAATAIVVFAKGKKQKGAKADEK